MSSQKKSLENLVEITDESFEPYIGPRSFKRETEDRLRFFGRDADTDERRLCLILIICHVWRGQNFNL